jgi:Fur family transcriptional regulator, zinc uptake regulator
VSDPVFTPATLHRLELAEQACAKRGARLTDLRRQVLGLILNNTRPSSAYDLLDNLRASHKGAAPPTVYRALEFLLDQGLVHKIERLSAYIGCAHDLDHAACAHEHHLHAAQFLICDQCGRAAELDDSGIGDALTLAARRDGFTPRHTTVEVNGLCADCRGGVPG